MPFTTPLALLGLLFVPAVVAMYLLKLRRERDVGPVDAPVAAPRRRRRGERAVAAPPPEPAVPAPAAPRHRPRRCSPPGRSSSGRPASPATSSSSSTRRRAWARPTSRPTGWPPRKAGRDRRAQGPPGRRQGQRDRGRAGPPGSSSTGSTDLGRVRLAIDSIRPHVGAGRPRRRARARLGSSRPSPATPRSSSRPTPRSRPCRQVSVDAPVRVLRVGATPAATTRRSSRSPSGRRRRRSPGRSS